MNHTMAKKARKEGSMMRVRVKGGSLLERARHLFSLRHFTKHYTTDFREVLLYIVLACRRQTEVSEEWYRKTVHALVQLLRRAAMRGMDKRPDEVVYWYLDPCIRSDDIEAHIAELAQKRYITKQDFNELFFQQ